MKAAMSFFAMFLWLGFQPGLVADEPKGAEGKEAKEEPGKQALSMRQKFVPVRKEKEERNRANWTKLHRSVIDPGVLTAMAHAGVGDIFPVSDPEDRKLFEVLVVDGDDGHLVLEVRAKEGAQRIALVRDMPTDVTVGGAKYALNFPTVEVGPDSKPTTELAMILVKQRP